MKTFNRLYYISILALAAGFASCTDDEFLPASPVGNPDAITFSAYSVGASQSALTRGAEEEEVYEPLVLTGEGDTPLYLHTYDAHKIGFDPAEDTEIAEDAAVQTRGMQVKSADDLRRYHKNFQVLANKKADGSNYLGWSETRIADETNNIWYTNRTEYWPSDEMLTFHAVSPATELTNLEKLSANDGHISFDYEARKGSQNKDAELQQDLLLAGYECNKSGSNNGRAPLEFHHALSAVKFAVRDVLGGEVVNVTISGVHSQGHCDFTYDAETKKGSVNWSGQSGSGTYSQDFNYAVSDRLVDPSDASQDEVLNDKMPEKTFMMIPQEIPADAEIIVTLKRTGVTPEQITVKGKIRDNHLTEWRPGHEYIYTISTSKDNWVYIFNVKGNSAEGTGNIFVYSPSNEAFDTYGNTAYYSVKSYRYRANKQTLTEILPWKASHGGSYSYNIDGGQEVAYPTANPQQKYVTAEQWITDTYSTPLSGSGSLDDETHNLNFLPHYVSTTWKGDETMQAYQPYSGFSQDNPYDLSTFGGTKNRYTANCYVIDRGGWYMFPLVYGNAVKNGKMNSEAYTSQKKNPATALKILPVLYKHDNTPITDPYIQNVPSNACAELIWQDAYDMVEQIELVTINDKKMIRFHIDPNSIQQGNAIIALKDRAAGTVLWSWHIWATEHWLDPDTRLPHVLDKVNPRFKKFVPNATTGIRECGDVEVTYNQNGRSFMMAPYNVGWCDPKKVLYLKRKSDMDFVQYRADCTTKTGKTAQLPIIQEGEVIDYKFANNTYYQWGRKDPMRGYFNHEHATKRTFGPSATKPTMVYMEDVTNGVTIGRSIQGPHEFYVSSRGDNKSPYQDWLTDNFKSNLWNNDAQISLTSRDDEDVHADLWSHTKTVYDPSPVGYMVPNAGVWHVVQKNWSDVFTDLNGKIYTTTYSSSGGTYGDKDCTIPVHRRDKWAGGNWYLNLFNEKKINGKVIDPYNYQVWAQGHANIEEEALFFSSTGNRWWSDGWKPNDIGAGGNFGRNVSYAWSNRAYEGRNSYGMAVGLDTDKEEADPTDRYYVGGQFIGRRAMGRPIRSIRELDF